METNPTVEVRQERNRNVQVSYSEAMERPLKDSRVPSASSFLASAPASGSAVPLLALCTAVLVEMAAHFSLPSQGGSCITN